MTMKQSPQIAPVSPADKPARVRVLEVRLARGGWQIVEVDAVTATRLATATLGELAALGVR